jgi:hypothetical protein
VLLLLLLVTLSSARSSLPPSSTNIGRSRACTSREHRMWPTKAKQRHVQCVWSLTPSVHTGAERPVLPKLLR